MWNETIQPPETNGTLFLLGAEFARAEFVRGQVCQGPRCPEILLTTSKYFRDSFTLSLE